MFAWLGLAVTSLGAGIGGFSLKRKKREDEEKYELYKTTNYRLE